MWVYVRQRNRGISMNKVLLVGNGFDLAHGLLTSYGDFLYLMQNWNEFKKAYKQEIEKYNEKKKEIY